MLFGGVTHATLRYDTLVVYKPNKDFVFPVFSFGAWANLLDDNVRVPFHCSTPPFCQLFAMPVM